MKIIIDSNYEAMVNRQRKERLPYLIGSFVITFGAALFIWFRG